MFMEAALDPASTTFLTLEQIRINNEEMVRLYDRSKEDPRGFFLSFNEEVSVFLSKFRRANEAILSTMNLFVYSRLMERMRGVDTYLEIEFDGSEHGMLRTKYVNHLEHLDKLDEKRKLRMQTIAPNVMKLLHALFSECSEKRIRLVFISFNDHPHLCKELPVLPLEWVNGNSSFLNQVLSERMEKKGYPLCRHMETGWELLTTVYQLRMTMDCDFGHQKETVGKVCIRHPESYNKNKKMAKVFNTSEMDKSWLVRLARRCGLPEATSETPRNVLCRSLDRFQASSLALIYFKNYFEDFLMEGLKKDPRFVVVMKGGYNLKMLLEEKFKENVILLTSDLDFMVCPVCSSAPGGSETPKWGVERILSRMDKEFRAFVDLNEYTRSNFFYKPTILRGEKNELLLAIMQIRFRGKDFADFSLMVNDRHGVKMVDKTLSKRIGLPIKKFAYAVMDTMEIILREVVPGLDPHTFHIRNPFFGERPEKGIRDLYRIRLACEAFRQHPNISVTHRKMIAEICHYSPQLTYQNIKRVTTSGQKKDYDFLLVIAKLIQKFTHFPHELQNML
jgi:hypothetical protein